MLVSCVMPTTLARREWIGLALECFAAQSYADRELVVASEDDAVRALLPRDARIRFVATPPGVPLGEKRNLVNAAVHGKWIAHWDDDDWYAPWRLAEQIRTLEAGPVNAISGSRTLVFVDLATDTFWKYTYAAGSQGAHGATLCYSRDIWKARPFRAIHRASDYYFCNDAVPSCVVVEPAQTICVATVHTRNTAPRQLKPPMWRQVDHTKLPAECRTWLVQAQTLALIA